MTDVMPGEIPDLIEQLRLGNDSARWQLLDLVYHRLRRIAAVVFREDFPRLQAVHDLDSVVDEAWVQLLKALETARPASTEDFYRLIFRKVRQVLIDMARRDRRHEVHRHKGPIDLEGSDAKIASALGDTTHEPSRLAVWTEFHSIVEGFPESQRMVFDFYYLTKMSQADIARLLDLSPKQVSRLWQAAVSDLAEWLGGSGVRL
jgi:RNA polymerase sigma factor (sigma-70 family)